MSERIYYANVSSDAFENDICSGLIDTFSEIEDQNYIRIESYDMSLLGKMWTGSEWVDNPNYVEPEAQ